MLERLFLRPLQQRPAAPCVRPPHGQAVDEAGIDTIAPKRRIRPLQGDCSDDRTVEGGNEELPAADVPTEEILGKPVGPLMNASAPQPRRHFS
jgi:hypothetical protein